MQCCDQRSLKLFALRVFAQVLQIFALLATFASRAVIRFSNSFDMLGLSFIQ
jgi:hypothetical protein